jgi:predicted kinase
MITVLMGAPGAGKSTWVAANKTGLEYIYNTEAVRVNRDLDVGRVWLNLASRLSLPTKLVVFNTNYETCLQVQLQRQHPAPANIVRRHTRLMHRAMHEIKSENWGEIEIITR